MDGSERVGGLLRVDVLVVVEKLIIIVDRKARLFIVFFRRYSYSRFNTTDVIAEKKTLLLVVPYRTPVNVYDGVSFAPYFGDRSI